MSNEAKIGIQVELAALRKQLAESGERLKRDVEDFLRTVRSA